MSNATDPSTPANSDCRAAIGADLRGNSKSEILGNGREAMALICPPGDAGQLCLPGTQSNGLLRS
eukprot:5252354-Alexandrium_andersonii.AAC.1